MDRRAFLAVIATGLAGCGSSGSTTTPTGTPPSETSTGGSTPTPTTEAPDSNSNSNDAGSSPTSRKTYDEAIRSDLLSVTADTWFTKHRIRWYNERENWIEYAEPSNGAFYSVQLTLMNLGENSVKVPSFGDFSLFVDGNEYPLMRDLPDSVRWNQLRQRPDRPRLSKPQYSRYGNSFLEPGKWIRPSLLFDAPATEKPLIVWKHSKPVEGTDAPIYLETDGRV